jgi:hypothetical protein
MLCVICEKRRPRRYCPGVRGEICAVCCGTEREVTVRCPSDCPYLMEARKHEQTAGLEAEKIPHRDIPISSEFIEDYEGLITMLSLSLTGEADRIGAVDSDAREALESLVQTYRTLESGIIYESLPANPLAASLHHAIRGAAARYMEEERKALGLPKTRDADVLRAIVFLDVFALDRNNGRKYGRAFLDAIGHFQPPEGSAGGEPETPSLILP